MWEAFPSSTKPMEIGGRDIVEIRSENNTDRMERVIKPAYLASTAVYPLENNPRQCSMRVQ